MDAKTAHDYTEELNSLKQFLQTVQNYNTVPRLKNFLFTVTDIEAKRKSLDIIKSISNLEEMAIWASNFATYLAMAMEKLPDGNDVRNRIQAARDQFRVDISAGSSSDDIRTKWIPLFKQLKTDYVEEYLSLHKKYRLDRQQDDRKKKLMAGQIFKSLKELSLVDMMDRASFRVLSEALIDLRTCYGVTQAEIEREITCPHCHLNPAEIKGKPDASLQLNQYEDDLDRLHETWKDTLRGNLSDPFVTNSIDLLDDGGKASVKNFLNTGKLPEFMDGSFIKAINEVLKGLEKIEVSVDEIKDALTKGGTVCNPTEFQERFEQYVGRLLKGKEKDRIRITIR